MLKWRTFARRRRPELMDQPGLSPTEHERALRGLARINAVSGSGRILWPHLDALAKSLAPRPLEVLDVATGGGDLPRWLDRRSGGIFHITGLDRSETAIEFAKRQSPPRIQFVVGDALAAALPGSYDVVVSSLFTHHLDEDDVVALLAKMAAAARSFILVNDLERSALGYNLAWLGTRLLTRSPIVHFDGPVSVEAAWTRDEMRRMAERAGLKEISVVGRFPCRFLLCGRRT